MGISLYMTIKANILTLVLFYVPFTLVLGQGLPKVHQFSHEIEEGIASGEFRITSASYLYTFISNYHQAIAAYDIPVSWGVDSLELNQYQIKPALQRIVEAAKDKQIVIISESHLKPQHRIFAKEVIVALAEHGFSYLGMETLSPDLSRSDQLLDTMLNVRGYADFEKSGYYSREPQMGDLIRTAKGNGYILFGYEREKKDPNISRDEIHANNVIKYMENHPANKVILLCGWYHAIESELLERQKSTWMARYLKLNYSIDPLTIYQDNFTEKVLQNEHELLAELQIEEPSVFVDDRDQIVRLTDKVDIEVIHPKTTYVNGRPGWLYQDQSYKEYKLDKKLIDMEYPLFLRAYLPGEEKDGTPVDVVELKEKYDQRRLILRPGKYVIRIDNKLEERDVEIVVE